MIRLVSLASLVCLASLAGCFESHGAGIQELHGDNCVLCHTTEYQQTAAPVHADWMFPNTCVDCHTTADWQPALGGLHPEASTYKNAAGGNETFLLSDAHAGIGCLACHDLSLAGASYSEPRPLAFDRRGLSANCIQCHPDDAYQRASHQGAVSAIGGAYTAYRADVPSFCRACHPEGKARKHPEAAFPIKTGDHSPYACADCHKRASGLPDDGGQNTSCVGCHHEGVHSLTKMDEQHKEVSNYAGCKARPPSDANRTLNAENFCLHCHPNGDGERNLACP